MHDIVIRGGTIVDGSGGEPFVADVAIDGKTITHIGSVNQMGREEIDARGKVVMPGFVDVHTHYDGQILWEDHIAPSSSHGVTTVIMGNCGVGFAPCRATDRSLLLKVMEGVEEIPQVVMAEGLPWNWETFPEYMDALDQRRTDVDFAAQVPHGPLRVYVMGKRGAAREPANGAELMEMSRLVEEALRAGAIGISSSHINAHRAVDGTLSPCETAAPAEMLALAQGLRNAGTGVIDYISEFPGLAFGSTIDFDIMRDMVKLSGRPLAFSLFQMDHIPDDWKKLLELVDRANAEGIAIRGQVASRAIGITYGLDLTHNPFSYRPAYEEIAHLPVAERAAAMREPGRRSRILAEAPDHSNKSTLWLLGMVGKMFVIDERFDYERPLSENISNLAAARGISAEEMAYEVLSAGDGASMLYLPITNYTEGSLDNVLEMIRNPNTVVALGDGGAHYGGVCDAAYPTFFLAHWVRDRAGTRLSLPEAVRALTHEPAISVDLLDRGLLREGYKADVNVIDMERLKVHMPEVRHDLPGGAPRMHQAATGYVATILSGEITLRDDMLTDALPGRLVRFARPAPESARRAEAHVA